MEAKGQHAAGNGLRAIRTQGRDDEVKHVTMPSVGVTDFTMMHAPCSMQGTGRGKAKRKSSLFLTSLVRRRWIFDQNPMNPTTHVLRCGVEMSRLGVR
jgi:hypothetical protein